MTAVKEIVDFIGFAATAIIIALFPLCASWSTVFLWRIARASERIADALEAEFHFSGEINDHPKDDSNE